MKHQPTVQKPRVPTDTQHTVAKIAVLVGLLFQTLVCGATLSPYQPPTLEQKVKRARVIVVATVGEVLYYKWPDVGRSELPKISEVPSEGYNPYINLVDIKVLFDTYASTPADRNPLKTNMLLWTQQRTCFAEYGEKDPDPLPKGGRFIFFIGGPVRSSQDTLMETACHYKSEPISEIPAVNQLIRSIKEPSQ